MRITFRRFERNGLLYEIFHDHDDDSSIDDKTDIGAGRISSYHRGEWWYIGVCVNVRLNTSSRWADGGAIVGRSSLWSVESDSGDDYLDAVENDLIVEAENEAKLLRAALNGVQL